MSDAPGDDDHHVVVHVNGAYVSDARWDGKKPHVVDALIAPGVLRGGGNELSLESVLNGGARYSMVMLDRFDVIYRRSSVATGSSFEGRWPGSGNAIVSGVDGAAVLDVTDGSPSWLKGVVSRDGASSFAVEEQRNYWIASDVLTPEVRHPTTSASALVRRHRRTEWLLVGPASFLPEGAPLIRQRRRQRLRAKAIPLEAIFEAFGGGEPRPEALRDFFEELYHDGRLRYAVLLGDGTFDYKDYLQTAVPNRVPPLIVQTSYLWTASDPALAAVNGDDLLPDFAIGRLPAGNRDEARRLVRKIIAYENERNATTAPVVLVADVPDAAGDFEANVDELSRGVLRGRSQRKLFLSR